MCVCVCVCERERETERVCKNVCAHKRPNKAEIDAVLGGESFLMVADIQPQKILHWMWKRSKPRTSNWEPKKKKRKKTRANEKEKEKIKHRGG